MLDDFCRKGDLNALMKSKVWGILFQVCFVSLSIFRFNSDQYLFDLCKIGEFKRLYEIKGQGQTI